MSRRARVAPPLRHRHGSPCSVPQAGQAQVGACRPPVWPQTGQRHSGECRSPQYPQFGHGQ